MDSWNWVVKLGMAFGLLAVPALGVGDIVPDLPKDLKATCTVYRVEGSGFSTFGPPQVGDKLNIDLTNPLIGKGTLALTPGPGSELSYLVIGKDLKLAFSEFGTHVYGARYGADPESPEQILVTMNRLTPQDEWKPFVVIQERRSYGWEWIAPATLRLICD